LFYIAWDVVFLVGDVSTMTAFWAHVGGFLAGLLIAITCAFMGWLRPEEDEQTLLQMVGIQGRNPVRFVQR
jgi:membrane associated rhomboid family serine protease